MLPGPHVQPVVLHRRRGRDRMTPRRAQPLHSWAVPLVASDAGQRLQNVACTHVVQPVKQGPRVVQHHPRSVALVEQLRDELGHAPVAPQEHRRVVVVTDIAVLHHPPEIADDPSSPQIVATRRNQRLVHVQRDSKRAVDLVDTDRPVCGPERAPAAGRHRLVDQRFRTADVRQPVHARRKATHVAPWSVSDPTVERKGNAGRWPATRRLLALPTGSSEPLEGLERRA